MNNLTVVVPYRNQPEALSRLLDSLPTGLPVVIVDDQSERPPAKRDGVHIVRMPGRGYFSGAVNAGLGACDTDVLVLNQDMMQVGPAWMADIDRLRQEYAVIGDGVMNHPAHLHGYVQGTCMFMRRDAINVTGGFNERDFPLWGATAEWQVRACRKGFRALPMDTSAWFAHERTERYGSAIAEFVQQEPARADWAKRTPPLITVVMACYNYGRYLEDAVNSLRGGPTSLGPHPGQTFSGWECIIVDDCSSDETPVIAKSLADAWQGIRYIRLAHNAGTAGAYNAGIKAGFGRYFMPLSADDMLEPAALDTMYRVVEDDPEAVAYTDLQLFRDGQRGKVWEMKEYDFEALLERNHMPAGIMATKHAWAKVGGYPAAFGQGREDWAMAVALGRAGYCGVRIPEPLYLYRRAGQNRSATNGTAEWRAHFVAQMRQTFPELYRGERPMGCCGGARRAARTVQHAPQAAPARGLRAGENGMTLIEYIGGSAGKQAWWGPVTGIRYEFGGQKRIGYIDDRDLPAMYEIVQGRRPVFKRYAQPAQPAAPRVIVTPAVVDAPPMAPVITPTQLPVYEKPMMTTNELFHGEGTSQPANGEMGDPPKPKRTRKAKHV